jgi:hypothetical protein
LESLVLPGIVFIGRSCPFLISVNRRSGQFQVVHRLWDSDDDLRLQAVRALFAGGLPTSDLKRRHWLSTFPYCRGDDQSALECLFWVTISPSSKTSPAIPSTSIGPVWMVSSESDCDPWHRARDAHGPCWCTSSRQFRKPG